MESKQSLFDLREKFSNLYINEVDTDHAAYVPKSKIDKIFNSIAKIKINKRIGTGFFMKLEINNNELYFLVTCHHVILEKDVDSQETILISYGNKNEEIKKEIELNKSERFIKCFDEPIDITLIEIIFKDSIPINKFLIPDYNYKNSSGFNYYLNKDCYSAGYPCDKEVNGECVECSGKITEIKDFEFSHTLDTRCGSSGSPICLIANESIVGIHKAGINKIKTNYGTFIGIVIKELEKNIGIIFYKRSLELFEEDSIDTRFINKYIKKQVKDSIKCTNILITLGKLLSKAELYAFKFGNNKNILDIKLFGYYDECDNETKNSKLKLFEILKKDIELFQDQYKKYCLKYENLYMPRQIILDHLIKLKSFFNDGNEIFIYDNIINILERRRIVWS